MRWYLYITHDEDVFNTRAVNFVFHTTPSAQELASALHAAGLPFRLSETEVEVDLIVGDEPDPAEQGAEFEIEVEPSIMIRLVELREDEAAYLNQDTRCGRCGHMDVFHHDLSNGALTCVISSCECEF